MRSVVALFGEAEKGQFRLPYNLKSMPQLIDHLGNPPEDSQGLFFAIQAMLFQREIIYFRVEDEGFSHSDYFNGFKHLENIENLHAICMPGVGDPRIIEASKNICEMHNSLLITSQKDLYDYLTAK